MVSMVAVLAEQKGFRTAKGARPDTFRAANWILRSALEGKILVYLLPPGFCEARGNYYRGYWRTGAHTPYLLH